MSSDTGWLHTLAAPSQKRILLLVLDGLGGLPDPKTGLTELETAHTPNLDALASESACGLHDPIGPGITPGSGPAHLALFGYNPIQHVIGRGILAAAGIGFALEKGDVAARINFCSVDLQGVIRDRRAGRIKTEDAARLCERLDDISLGGVELFIRPVKDHRAVLILRGHGLSGAVSDSDPQKEGHHPLPVRPVKPEAEKTAKLAEEFLRKAAECLAAESPANMILLRGFDQTPHLSTLQELYGLHAACVAAYPMYKGLARLAGMEILSFSGETFGDQITLLEEHYQAYHFFFLHYKNLDSAGEDGDFAGRVHILEEVDKAIPRLARLEPDVLLVTGDHSTPAILRSHSWHPVPFLLRSRVERRDTVKAFGETACAGGVLGRLPASQLLPLALASAGRLNKFGA